MPGWSTQDIPNQRGERFVVTGAMAGLGFETALALAAKGADVILVGRNGERGAAAAARIMARGGGDVRFAMCDLANLASVAAFAGRMLVENVPLDCLVNNAGVMALPQRQETTDGFERQFGVNYLAHFALTARLLPLLRKARAPRVVSLSSLAHRRGAICFDDLQSHAYSRWRAYRQSKLAMLMFARALQRRSDAAGWGVASLAAHPGWARTELFEAEPGAGQGKGIETWGAKLILPLLGQSAAQGALPALFAATAVQAMPGGYYGPSGWLELKGAPAPAVVSAAARDEAAGDRLWTMSEAMAGVAFPAPAT